MSIMRDFWKNILRKRIADDDEDASNACNSILSNFERFLEEHELGINEDDFFILDQNISKDEILKAIDGIKLGKACGKDGLPIEFYATHTRGDDGDINSNYLTKILYKMYLESHNRGELPHTLKESIVTLVF